MCGSYQGGRIGIVFLVRCAMNTQNCDNI